MATMVAFNRQYDANGNRTEGAYSTGTANQLLSDGVYTYTYDNEGNRLTQTTIVGGSVTAYTWDNRNRLTEVDHYASSAAYAAKTSDWSVQYTYDYLDRQIQRKVDSNGSAAGGVDYFYNVYQGDDVALEIEDPDGLGAGASPHVAYRYLDGQALDEVLASETENSSGTPTSVLWGLGDNCKRPAKHVGADCRPK